MDLAFERTKAVSRNSRRLQFCSYTSTSQQNVRGRVGIHDVTMTTECNASSSVIEENNDSTPLDNVSS